MKISFTKGTYVSKKFNSEKDAAMHYNEFKKIYCKKKVETIVDDETPSIFHKNKIPH